MSRNRFSTISLALLAAIAIAFVFTSNVTGTHALQPGSDSRIATVDLLTLLEDQLQTEDYKPGRDAFRTEWESRIEAVRQRLQRIETEIQMLTPADPNFRQLQQQYQQSGYEFQQLSRDATIAFDQFNAEQAAEAYETLHENAAALAEGLGYSHLYVSRQSGEIVERGNLATVTQEILARSVVISPEGDDLTDRLRERLSIPTPPEPVDAASGAGDEPSETDSQSEESDSD